MLALPPGEISDEAVAELFVLMDSGRDGQVQITCADMCR